MCKWDKFKKPPENICPQKFCFIWSEDDKKCRETFGLCKRHAPDKSHDDWYEPCEPELKKHGLPWFYFIPNADKLVDELKEDYSKQANELWTSISS